MISCSSPSAPSCPTPAGGCGSEINRLVNSWRKVCCAQARIIAARDCADVRGALVRISLASITDPEVRQRLQAIPTGLTIPDKDVDLLVSSGEQLVQQYPGIRELIVDLDERANTVMAQRGPASSVGR